MILARSSCRPAKPTCNPSADHLPGGVPPLPLPICPNEGSLGPGARWTIPGGIRGGTSQPLASPAAAAAGCELGRRWTPWQPGQALPARAGRPSPRPSGQGAGADFGTDPRRCRASGRWQVVRDDLSRSVFGRKPCSLLGPGPGSLGQGLGHWQELAEFSDRRGARVEPVDHETLQPAPVTGTECHCQRQCQA